MTDDLVKSEGAAGSIHLRIVAAILAAAAKLVPVPFLDDLLRERITQLVVKQTLLAHGRTYGSGKLKPIWSGDDGCLRGCLLMVLKAPIVLITYPIRKVWAWVTAIRGLARDLAEMILLGRALDRELRAGVIADDAPDLEAQARRFRKAFDNAISGMDLKVLRSALRDALRKVSGLGGAAVRGLRSLWRRRVSGDSEQIELPPGEQRALDQGARNVEAVLARPEIIELMERFDARFEENLRILATRE